MKDTMDLPQTIQEAAAALRAGTTSSVQLTEAALERTRALDEIVGAFIVVTDELAMTGARQADADFAAGIDKGPLQGIPFALKDILATSDAPTTANSLVLDRTWGEGYDSVTTERLRAAGAALMGKLVCSEFALGMPDDEKPFPIPKNPWALDRTPGGSSSGTGIAVSTGMILGGIGTDTGGSVRFPAAYCGHSGLKVTYGRVPKWGVVPLGYSLDSIGPMARSAWDCAAIMNVIAGYDARDMTSATAPVPDFLAGIDGSIAGLKVGVPTEYFFDHPLLDPEQKASTESVIATLKDLGAEIVEVNLPHAAEAKEANTLTMVAEAFAYHRMDMSGGRWQDYGRGVRNMVSRGALYGAADYIQAQRFRSYFAKEAAKVMATVDVLVTPSIVEPAGLTAGMDMSKRMLQPSYAGPFNLLGYPALAIPSGFSSGGLPLSTQIVGAPFAEALTLKVGHAYQQVTAQHLAVPPIVLEVAAA
jgi:aspartyl-tRNA(Asn)/glutamyl-tRNA(Gln) amidotransferase subunit A